MAYFKHFSLIKTAILALKMQDVFHIHHHFVEKHLFAQIRNTNNILFEWNFPILTFLHKR